MTIPEGYTVKQIAARLRKQSFAPRMNLLRNATRVHLIMISLRICLTENISWRGIFSDTYLLHEGMTAHDIIDMMLARFDQMYTKEYQKAVADSGHTLDEIVTVASMS